MKMNCIKRQIERKRQEESKKKNGSYKRNIKLDFLYRFMNSFDISSAVWVLYMVYKGLSLWQIGVVEGVFHITSFLFEVPSGAVADLLGRKKVILAGRLCTAFSSLMLLRADSMVLFIISYIISALGYNLNSGSEESLVFDSMKAEGREKEYHKVNGSLEVVCEVSNAAAVLVGGVLSEYSFTWCYLAVLTIALASLVPVLLFKEPPKESGDETKSENSFIQYDEQNHISLREHAAACVRILRGNADVRKILLYYPAVSALWCVIYFYGQEYFSRLGLNKIEVSLVMMGNGVVSVLGAMCSEKMTKKLGNSTRFIAGSWIAAGTLLVSSRWLPAAIVGFLWGGFSAELLSPLESVELNSRIPSAQRATIISMDSMMFSVYMMGVFPLMGFLADITGMAAVFGITGMLLLAVVVLAIRGWKD